MVTVSAYNNGWLTDDRFAALCSSVSVVTDNVYIVQWDAGWGITKAGRPTTIASIAGVYAFRISFFRHVL